MTLSPRRLASVDAFRALTMFLMIFVNDLWSLSDIPDWLEHAKKMEDRMGLADIVFPAFLFIVGLSIPFAIGARAARGYSWRSSFLHILTRSFALLVMGIFHVNLENYSRTAAILPRPVWQIGITVAFFLVWLDYGLQFPKRKKYWLRGCGVGLLVLLALLYRGRGEDPAPADSFVWMQLQWYGILGLIGWCYLLCALLYLMIRDKWAALAGCFLFFIGFTIADKEGWLFPLDGLKDYFWIVSSGALPALTMAGVLCAVVYRQQSAKNAVPRSLSFLILLGIVLLVAGFAIRPLGGISKIRATPSWVLICTAISIGSWVILIYVMDLKGWKKWIRPLRPAGTSTLTCYLLPYIHYAILNLLGPAFRLPLVLRTGSLGIIKSLLYAFLIIAITGLLEKRKIRLSI
jgi:heparan-alpha-glucosaminide N-acetyltransferase